VLLTFIPIPHGSNYRFREARLEWMRRLTMLSPNHDDNDNDGKMAVPSIWSGLDSTGQRPGGSDADLIKNHITRYGGTKLQWQQLLSGLHASMSTSVVRQPNGRVAGLSDFPLQHIYDCKISSNNTTDNANANRQGRVCNIYSMRTDPPIMASSPMVPSLSTLLDYIPLGAGNIRSLFNDQSRLFYQLLSFTYWNEQSNITENS
jgi:hypothetical protein